jgi:hypothetical protein
VALGEDPTSKIDVWRTRQRPRKSRFLGQTPALGTILLFFSANSKRPASEGSYKTKGRAGKQSLCLEEIAGDDGALNF